MEDKILNEVGEYLNRRGYGIDLKDQLWMEDYIEEHKFRDLVELIYDYEQEKIREQEYMINFIAELHSFQSQTLFCFSSNFKVLEKEEIINAAKQLAKQYAKQKMDSK